ncbi:DJ-1/PfpI family protein [Nannocystis radixulma]|uniref:DJ-1/PfpI family protein n=1 Tax=Nannocystis radixulma TaxID=2995305 RepID=A0ABT5B242_9BACT|nr:DJ-1/PfpI family protein [Nannocystis radixulma]MDC0668177.1 DJ-1/PfpI family protein [Nannocystis radixulma]
MKHIVLVAFDRFTDIDLFLAWDLFRRIDAARCDVRIVAKNPRITSSTGITIDCHGPLAAAREADAVYFCSGQGSRALADDPEFADAVRLDESRQVLAAIDSGAILLGALGHLHGRRATTYPSPDLRTRLLAAGATPVDAALVTEGNVATAAQCLAGVELVRWVITRLFDRSVADATIATAAPLGAHGDARGADL